MSKTVVTKNTSKEFERACTLLQCSFGCVIKDNGDTLEIYAFFNGDSDVIIDTLLQYDVVVLETGCIVL